MKVAKWGNSLAVRIPKAVVDGLNLKSGDEIQVALVGRHLIEVSRKPTAAELLEGLRKFRGMLPADFKFDREEANKR
jgi:antitoxin MazE